MINSIFNSPYALTKGIPLSHQTVAEKLDCLLKSHSYEQGVFSSSHIAKLDRLEMFPSDACRILDKFGLNLYYVPVQYGGSIVNYEEILQLWRIVARRDLTVAIGHGKTFLGAICVWLGGSYQQSLRLSKEIVEGAIVSWGLTERHHGSDLLSGELKATKTANGWCINGEKWLINNAIRSHFICILSRTNLDRSPRAFSLFLVDKRQLPSQNFCCLQKERTHGIRGADISGIVFKNAEVPDKALLGKQGEGLEIVLKALQLTRTLCVAMSLGATDSALQLVLEFAKQHRLYNRYLIELPQTRRTLGEVFTKLIVTEVVSIVASRCIQALTEEMSIVSAITKSFVPSTVDEIIDQLSEQLGARAFLTEQYENGMFQKIERDHRIIAIFDGSTIVNRNALINQFHILTNAYYSKCYDQKGIIQATTLTTTLPEFDPKRLNLLSNKGCSILQSLPFAVKKVCEYVNQGVLSPKTGDLSREMQKYTELIINKISKYNPSSNNTPTESFMLAMQYELCFAGAACLQLWLNTHKILSNCKPSLWQNAFWLEASLTFILERSIFESKIKNRDIYECMFDKLIENEKL
jgi:alkylation response protein AidB-like acyl-CoA dehydrogenase